MVDSTAHWKGLPETLQGQIVLFAFMGQDEASAEPYLRAILEGVETLLHTLRDDFEAWGVIHAAEHLQAIVTEIRDASGKDAAEIIRAPWTEFIAAASTWEQTQRSATTARSLKAATEKKTRSAAERKQRIQAAAKSIWNEPSKSHWLVSGVAAELVERGLNEGLNEGLKADYIRSFIRRDL